MGNNINTYEDENRVEEVTRKELNTSEYIDWYVNEFTSYFPNVYSKEALKKILLETVKHIYLIYDTDEDYDERYDGTYCTIDHSIRLVNLDDKFALFHEFTHALIEYYHPFIETNSDPYSEDFVYDEEENQKNELAFIEHRAYEGYVEFICCLYNLRKVNNDSSINRIKLKQPKINRPYLYGSSFYSLFNGLYESVFKDGNIIEKGLKGDNIYKYIYDILYKYISCIHDDDKECVDTAYRLSFMVLRYLADFGNYNPYGNIAYEEIIDEYTTLEYIIRSILITLSNNHVISNYDTARVGYDLVTTKMPTAEDRLIAAIFGDTNDSMTYKKINNILSDFILQGDEIEGRGSSGK